jgi:putative SOS response-associated peptidase YedK
MPAILEGAALEAWLDAATPASNAAALLLPFDAADLEWHPCTKRMNQLQYDGDDCARAISLRPFSIVVKSKK